jgi:hypothetical protein
MIHSDLNAVANTNLSSSCRYNCLNFSTDSNKILTLFTHSHLCAFRQGDLNVTEVDVVCRRLWPACCVPAVPSHQPTPEQRTAVCFCAVSPTLHSADHPVTRLSVSYWQRRWGNYKIIQLVAYDIYVSGWQINVVDMLHKPLLTAEFRFPPISFVIRRV